MAERGYSLIDCELQIKPKPGGTILDNNLNLLQSENSDFREVLNENSVLELQLNIDELQELHTMYLRSANRNGYTTDYFYIQMCNSMET